MSGLSAVVVLPAAGNGTRMKLPIPKQFCTIQNRPVISYTIEAFERVSFVEHIIVVAAPEWEQEMKAVLEKYKHNKKLITIVHGDVTRHRSISRGVDAVAKVVANPDVVIIHDGVRPFVPKDIIHKVAEAAKQYGAAGAVRPLVSTVIRPDGEGLLEESLDRSQYRNSEMPQAFQYEVIREAYQKCSTYEFDYGTECLLLARKHSNIRAKFVDGPDCLWKITHSKDLHFAEEFLKGQNGSITVTGSMCKFTELLLNALEKEYAIKSMSDSSAVLKVVNITQMSAMSNQLLSSNEICTPHELEIFMYLANQSVSPDMEVQIENKIAKQAQNQDGYVYGIFVKGEHEDHVQQISKILSFLIKDRNKAIIGQTFKIG